MLRVKRARDLLTAHLHTAFSRELCNDNDDLLTSATCATFARFCRHNDDALAAAAVVLALAFAIATTTNAEAMLL